MIRARLLSLALGAALLAGVAPAGADVAWTADIVHSRAEFLVSHLVVSKVWGHIPIKSLAIATDPSGLPTSLDVVLMPGHLDTDNHERDADLRSASYFDIEQYPTMTFKSQSVKATGKTSDGRTSFTCTGDLTIKNVTKPVVLTGTIEGRVPDGNATERIGYTATTTIDRRAFGLDDARMSPGGIPLVGDDVQITLTVEATRPKA
jgi:polyisoprenoid-binding protein YceI